MSNHSSVHSATVGAKLIPANFEVLPPNQTEPGVVEICRAIADQYPRAVGAMREVIVLGAMVSKLRDILSARGDSGNGIKGDGMKGLLAEHAPDVNLSTAYRFEAVFMSVANDYVDIVGAKVATQFPLADLILTPADQLPKHASSKQLLLFKYVEGTSQRSWLDKVSPPPERRGGNRHPKCPDCSGYLASKTQPFCPHCGKEQDARLTPEQQAEGMDAAAQMVAVDLCNQITTVKKAMNGSALGYLPLQSAHHKYRIGLDHLLLEVTRLREAIKDTIRAKEEQKRREERKAEAERYRNKVQSAILKPIKEVSQGAE